LSAVGKELRVKLKFKEMSFEDLLEAVKQQLDLGQERPLIDGEVEVYWMPVEEEG